MLHERCIPCSTSQFNLFDSLVPMSLPTQWCTVPRPQGNYVSNSRWWKWSFQSEWIEKNKRKCFMYNKSPICGLFSRNLETYLHKCFWQNFCQNFIFCWKSIWIERIWILPAINAMWIFLSTFWSCFSFRYWMNIIQFWICILTNKYYQNCSSNHKNETSPYLIYWNHIGWKLRIHLCILYTDMGKSPKKS